MHSPLAPGTPLSTPLSFQPMSQVQLEVPTDFHMHTNYTDGTASLDEMAEAVQEQGVGIVLFTEHVRHTSTYYGTFLAEVRGLSLPGVTAYSGIETKILDAEGTLDCSFEIASSCDGIVGSVHSPPQAPDGGPRSWSGMEPVAALELEFQLALAIVTKSRAHILGHPMGMAVTRFNLKPLEHLYRLAVACKESGKAFELNPRYCANTEEWIEVVSRAGCPVSFGSDAHRTADVGRAWRIFNRMDVRTDVVAS